MTSRTDAPPAAATPTVAADAAAPAPGLRTAGLLVLLCGGFLPVLDFFIVNVALPTMGHRLHASAPLLELVIAGYGGAYALMLVVGGRLGDAVGRRRLFLAGVSGFTLASLGCGLAPNVEVLVAFRVLQGLAAALSQPQVLATLHATLDGPKRAQAIGWYGGVGRLASSAGQLLGGLLVSANVAGLSWRPIFLVNVPIGITVLALAPRLVPATRSPRPASVDRSGTVALAVTLVALLIPLSEGPTLHWPAWCWILLGLAPVAAALTVAAERRLDAAGGVPLLAPSLLRLPPVRRGLLLVVPFFMGFGAFMFVLALTLQVGLHQSALRSGLTITPMALAFLAGSLLMPRLLARYGRSAVATGMIGQAVGLAGLAVAVAQGWPHMQDVALVPWLVLAGWGQAVGFVSLFRLVLAQVPEHLAGVGSGVLVTAQQASLALGVATLGTLYTSLATHDRPGAFATVIGIQAGIALVIAVASRWLAEPAAPPAAPTVVVVE